MKQMLTCAYKRRQEKIAPGCDDTNADLLEDLLSSHKRFVTAGHGIHSANGVETRLYPATNILLTGFDQGPEAGNADRCFSLFSSFPTAKCQDSTLN